MSKLLEDYRAALLAAHPTRNKVMAANRDARVVVYNALFSRWKADTLTRHFPAIVDVLNQDLYRTLEECSDAQ